MGAGSVRQRLVGLIAASLCAAACSSPAGVGESSVRSKAQPLSTTSITQSGDELRTSWYPNQPLLSPSVVSGSTFGQLFSAPVDGAVYAQPLVDAGTLFVATERNNIYGLDPETGAVRWTRNVGSPFTSSDIGCSDLSPYIGITSTPVIDSTTHIAYFFAKKYLAGNSGAVTFEAHAVSVSTGAEQPGFPVSISNGFAANDPTLAFTPRTLHQRPGLLLMNGVVYAGFAAHCDIAPWAGFIVGVSTSGQVKTLWSAVAGPGRTDGAGIWQSGSALVSDGDGQILFATGNGGTQVGPIAGHSPPQTLGESIVRTTVQPDGTLKATDFFEPYDAITLDGWDADFGAGGPVGLPSPYFGTVQRPHLLMAAGKQGYVYLLDRDNLGGIGNGPSGGDSVVSRIGPYGGVWSKPAVWPGDGGYVYMPTASGGNAAGGTFGNLRVFKYGVDGTGSPSLSLVATSTDSFGFSSSSPVITSDQTRSGSALVWVVWAPGGNGNGAQLRAYDALPVAGVPVLRYSAPVGQSAKFTPPGVGDGRLYVGTRDGQVRGFGAPMTAPLRGSALDLGSVVQGGSRQGTVTLTANTAVTVTSITSSLADFSVGASTPALPASLAANATLTIPVTFTPSSVGIKAGELVLQTSGGQFELAVSGQGQSAVPQLVPSPAQVSFGGVTSGAHAATSITFTNTGAAPLTINRVVPPDSSFGLTGAPSPGAVIAASASMTLTVTFDPVAIGNYTSVVALDTDAGLVEVPMSGVCAPAGHLTVSPLVVDFGFVALDQSPVASFTVANTGGSSLRITRSKPPALGAFNALTSLPEGTTLLPGDTLTEYVAFNGPPAGGAYSDTWSLNSDDGGGVQNVAFSATTPPEPTHRFNCGGTAVGNFAADQSFTGGTAYASTVSVSTDGVVNAAPAALYQSERYGNFSYALTGLIAGAPYTVRLHFAEIYFNAANSRLFNVSLNGTVALTNFDIFAAAGGPLKAVVRELNATADANGQIAVGFVGVKDNAKLSGIELIGSGTPLSAPPTVAAAATVTPSPVTSATATATVLGADDGGETSLIYTWSTVGTPPGLVTFSPNSRYAAKSTQLTFSAPGSYALLATIRDADGSTVTSSVNVVVVQTLSGIVISPASALVAPLGTVPFSVSGVDQFGASMSAPSVAWSVTGGGTISPSGLFTAGSSTGGPFTVSASGAGFSATTSVTVSSAPPVTPRINAGGFAVGNFLADQSFTGGAAFVSGSDVSTAGVANAAPAAVYQSERFGNFSYTLTGLAASGSYTVRLHFAEIYFTAANSRLFNVSINGTARLTNFDIFAEAGGAFKAVVHDLNAIADASGRIVVSFVGVKDNAKLSAIEVVGTGVPISPPTVATAATVTPGSIGGTSANASVLGADDGGESALTYTWATTGTSPGVVTFTPNASNAAKNTTLSFGVAGSYNLLVTIRDADGASVTSNVSVVVGQTLTSLAISPVTASVAPLGTAPFTASGKDQFGASMSAPSVAWTVSGGGTISTSGVFSAGSATGGPFTVSASSAGFSATASVNVSTAPPVALRVHAGGGAVGSFVADQAFTGGAAYSSTAGVSTAGVANAAPAAVYQTERYGNFSYALTGLTTGSAYTVRLHFAEIYFTAANSRLFNVSVNGTQALNNFDIFAAAGGAFKAVVRDLNATADVNGQIAVSFLSVKDNAKLSAIEFLPGAVIPPSAPPTVATPAAVSASPVTGTSVNASVLGADDGGETALTYTWSTVGTPPAPVNFSPNTSNSAKNSLLTFSAAGNYNLAVTIRDVDGGSVTSNVNVVVGQTLSGITVSPVTTSVAPLGSAPFSALGSDQFGASMSVPSLAWTVSGGGTISAAGLFTAGSATGGPFTVSASGSGFSGLASVNVSAAPPVTLRVHAGGGAVGSFLADQAFTGGTAYSSTAGVSTTGVANAAPASVYQTERYGNFSYTLTGLAVGSAYTVRLHFAEIYFTAANSRLLNVSINGTQALSNFDIFTAAGGAFKAVVRDLNATADVNGQIAVGFLSVKDNAKLSAIEFLPGAVVPLSAPPTVVTPAAVSATPITGKTASASVLGADDGGETALTYTWSTVGTPPGAVAFAPNASNSAKNTVLTFSAPGSYNLVAMIRDADGGSVSSNVSVVVSQTLNGITVSPPNATIAPLGTVPFTASGVDQFGVSMNAPSLAWTVSGGGTISASGLFTAGSSIGGPFTVSATGSGYSATASVSVVTAPPLTLQIHAGGGAVGSFVADEFFSGGTAYTSNVTIATAGVANAAPAAVYQTERYGNSTYTIGNLTPGSSYTLRLHFAEIYWAASNSRLFDVSVNGTRILASFDIFAAAGAQNKAVVKTFTVTANSTGQVVINFVTVKDNAKVSAIELLR